MFHVENPPVVYLVHKTLGYPRLYRNSCEIGPETVSQHISGLGNRFGWDKRGFKLHLLTAAIVFDATKSTLLTLRHYFAISEVILSNYGDSFSWTISQREILACVAELEYVRDNYNFRVPCCDHS